MDDRQHLLLAVGITEWASALTHLDVISNQGVIVPADVVRAIGRELAALIQQWPAPLGTSVDKVIADARRYCTEHVTEMDTLLAETRT